MNLMIVCEDTKILPFKIINILNSFPFQLHVLSKFYSSNVLYYQEFII